MRFVAGVIAVFLLALAGLYVYGLTLKPDVRTIEQEVEREAPNP